MNDAKNTVLGNVMLSLFKGFSFNLAMLFLVFSHSLNADDSLSIVDLKSNNTIEVVPIKVADGKFTFTKKGKSFTVPLTSLTAESQKSIKEWDGRSAFETKKINEAIGHSLFDATKSLWDEPISDVAGRLKWRVESNTKSSMSYRFYPRKGYQFSSTRPYCCSLYGGPTDKPSHLSLVFANKGDYGSKVGSGEDHFKPQGDGATAGSLDEAITQDAEMITKKLTECLGEPTEQRYGEKEDRRKVQRWNFRNHAFILSEKEEEYVHLLIIPIEQADAEGKTKFIKDQILKAEIVKNLIQSENGDCYINNIPMVDQGPKGYCAPATFERAMRYMRIPADMYLLATLATSEKGTNTRKLAEESKRIIRSKARRIKELDLSDKLSIKLVAKYTKKGIPILWQMRSLSDYNKIANANTLKRPKSGDLKSWSEEIAKEAKAMEGRLTTNINHHICLIIGYNEKTNEIAVSDSWGPKYKLRWIHVDIAKAVTYTGGFVIDL